MPSFLIKKYEVAADTNQQEITDSADKETVDPEKKTEQVSQIIEINASDSIAKIVAQALYKAMPNIEIIRQQQAERKSKESETAVVSTEQINSSPVDALSQIGVSKSVFVLGDGFTTAQEEWFLHSLENRGIEIFYTVSSFVKHIQQKLS